MGRTRRNYASMAPQSPQEADMGSSTGWGSPIDTAEYGGVSDRMGALGRRKAQGIGVDDFGSARRGSQYLEAAAAGRTPSAAEEMFQRGTETAQRGAMAGMATGRGGAGLMQMGAVQGQGQAVMGAAGQAAQIRAQEMAQARGQFMQGATAVGQLGLGEAEQTNRMRMAVDQQMTSLMQSGMSRDAALQTAQNQAYMNERQLTTDRYLGQMADRRERAIAQKENEGWLDDTTDLSTGQSRTSHWRFAPFGSGEKKYEEAPYRIGTPEFKSKYPEEKAAALHGDVLPKLSSEISKGRKHPTLGETREHQGRDFGVPQGTSLIAPFDGTVSRVGNVEGGPGRYIAIKKKGDSREIKIFHLSKIKIGAGTKVKKGETVLGLSGGTPGTVGAGASTGPHTHVEMWDRGEKESREVYPPLAADYPGTFVPGENKGVLLDVMDMPGVIPREAARQEKVAQAKKPEATSVESAPFEHIGPNPWVSRDIPMRELRRGKERSDLIAAQEQAFGGLEKSAAELFTIGPPNTDAPSADRAKSFNEALTAEQIKRGHLSSQADSADPYSMMVAEQAKADKPSAFEMSLHTGRQKGEWPSQFAERTGLSPDDGVLNASQLRRYGSDELYKGESPITSGVPRYEFIPDQDRLDAIADAEEKAKEAAEDAEDAAIADAVAGKKKKEDIEELSVTGTKGKSPWGDPDASVMDKLSAGVQDMGKLKTIGDAATLVRGGEGRQAAARSIASRVGMEAGKTIALAAGVPAAAPIASTLSSLALSEVVGNMVGPDKKKHYKSGPEERGSRINVMTAPFGSLSGYYSRMRGQ